jgi:peptide-methionine (S)-S-oxide reductase
MRMKRFRIRAALPLLLLLAAAGGVAAAGMSNGDTMSGKGAGGGMTDKARGATAVATFAGGCFWCMEAPFDQLDGVISTTSGYTGGHKTMPTYEEVSAGGTGHAESVEVVYDPDKVSYETLLDVYWHNVDPTTPDRQFCDRGHQYRTAIFYHNESQKRAAEASRDALAASGELPGPVVTEIVPAGAFWAAEDYHQNFYKEHPLKYRFYRYNCGRDKRLHELWGDEAGGHAAAAHGGGGHHG